MSLPKTLPLQAANNTTIQIPSVGYGTAGHKGTAKDATLTALRMGYRHLDCAWIYGVDGEIGAAIRESGVPRSELFITTKFWHHFGHPDDVELCLDKILHNMGLDYVDLYLAHWPIVSKSLGREALEKATTGDPSTTPAHQRGQATTADDKPILDHTHSTSAMAASAGQTGTFLPTWRAMQSLVHSGKTRTIGVSNFSADELGEILSADPVDPSIPLSCNQIEVHPHLPQTALLAFCRAHNVLVTCYSPFAGAHTVKGEESLLQSRTLTRLADETGLQKGQLLQSWAVQRGTVPLGKSADEGRMRAHLDVRVLEEGVMRELDGMALEGGKGRTCDLRGDWGVPGLFGGE
ncbi:hypothetical protein MBLNU230_g1490t1 [Neophaeotheca triangularis]